MKTGRPTWTGAYGRPEARNGGRTEARHRSPPAARPWSLRDRPGPALGYDPVLYGNYLLIHASEHRSYSTPT